MQKCIIQGTLLAFVTFLSLLFWATFALAGPMVESKGLGFQVLLPDRWVRLTQDELFALNHNMARFISHSVRGSDLEALDGWRLAGSTFAYPFVMVCAAENGRIPLANVELFNQWAFTREGALLETGIFQVGAASEDVQRMIFDERNWRLTITADAEGLVVRSWYIYTAFGHLILRGFFDAQSVRELPAMDNAVARLTLAKWNMYAPSGNARPQEKKNRHGAWLVYVMVFLILLGIGLTSYESSDEENHPFS